MGVVIPLDRPEILALEVGDVGRQLDRVYPIALIGESVDEPALVLPLQPIAPVERANATPYGLNASVWTDDEDRGRSIAQRIRCGMVTVNDAYFAGWTSVDAPMGGREGSGVGRRHGREGLLKYTEYQTIASQRVLPVMVGYGSSGRTRYVDRLARLYGVIRRIPGLR
ncbi:aldehyde dehydrogenase family protein [Halalkalicoccus sp. GCM10025322]|uniref:aldehyde dehydrogenase family protein n=1 Tax=Halalkalicoccus TaxID=332246 RepID=UPI002F964606